MNNYILRGGIVGVIIPIIKLIFCGVFTHQARIITFVFSVICGLIGLVAGGIVYDASDN